MRQTVPSPDPVSPARPDGAGTNPSSPLLNHRTANKDRRQYITGMWQALAIMTLRSLLGLQEKPGRMTHLLTEAIMYGNASRVPDREKNVL